MPAPSPTPAWVRRPVTAAALRVVMVLGPFVAGWVAIRLTQQFFFTTSGFVGFVAWIAQALVVAVLVGRVIARLADRLTPLHFLLGMTLVFPDHAPSRFRLALRSGTVRRLVASNGASVSAEVQQGAEDAVALVAVLRDHDPLTRGHTERVRAYAEMMGRELDLPDDELNKLRWGVLLHDVGKLEVPSEILNKAGRPTAEEWDVLRRHPGAGGDIVRPLAPWLGEWSLAAAQHHERWDGTGYPRGLSGTDISLAGRIASVADAYDVITSRRSYKEPLSAECARRELVDGAGTQFDPDMVRVMLQCGLKRQRTLGAFGWLLEIRWVSQIFGGLASAPAAATAAVVTAVAVASGAASVTAADSSDSSPVITPSASTVLSAEPIDAEPAVATETPAAAGTATAVETRSAGATTVAPAANESSSTTVVRPSTSIRPTTSVPVTTLPATSSTTPTGAVEDAGSTPPTTTTPPASTTSTTTSTTTTTTTSTTTTTTTLPAAQANCEAIGAGATDFPAADLSGCDFGAVAIDGIDLSGADLSGADLSEVSLVNYDLGGADLTGADLSDASFSDGSMVGAVFVGATSSGVEITRSDLAYTDASDVDFSSATLTDSSFGFAVLEGAVFDDSILAGVNFNDAQLANASFQRASMTGTEWWRAIARDAVFAESDLTEAVFGDTDLAGADLTGADLTRTFMIGATGTPAEVVAIYADTACPDGIVRSVSCW